MNAKTLRIIRQVLGLVLVCVLLCSALFIVAEGHHHCDGAGCRICACIHQCERLLRPLTGHPAALRSYMLSILSLASMLLVSGASMPQASPVAQKVRLNN